MDNPVSIGHHSSDQGINWLFWIVLVGAILLLILAFNDTRRRY